MERDLQAIMSLSKNIYFNSHAHVERDEELTMENITNTNFNSHAHVERDLAENICQLFHVVISTHTLTWSVTSLRISANSSMWSFQLTRSRGA